MARRTRGWVGLLFLPLLVIACGKDKPSTPTTSKSESPDATGKPASAAPHGPTKVNLMSHQIFSGRALNLATWRELEQFALAGPTQLIVADLLLVPDQMSQAGFQARWTVQLYALSRTYAGMDWLPGGDSESRALWEVRADIDAWWARYVDTVVQLMLRAPETTALIIANDGFDRLGRTLGSATMRQMAPVASRVTVGNTVPD